jgi:hypothetical protein
LDDITRKGGNEMGATKDCMMDEMEKNQARESKTLAGVEGDQEDIASLRLSQDFRLEGVLKEMAHRFTYHAPKGDQVERYGDLRASGLGMAGRIVKSCPDSRERSLAIRKLEEAIFWANAAIARNE